MTLHHRAKKYYYYPLFQLVLSITIFLSSARATTRVAAAAFAPTAGGHIVVATPRRLRRPLYAPSRTAGVVVGRTLRKMSNDATILESPSAERNKVPICGVLEERVFPSLIEGAVEGGRGKVNVLELAAGCGVHTTHFASSFLSSNEGMGLEWHPSDPDGEARASIDARVRRANLEGSVVPANGWILGRTGGTACGDGNRDRGDAGSGRSGENGDSADYEQRCGFFDLALCINMIHIAPWEATVGLMGCAGKVLRRGGMLVCYGPYKLGGTAVQSNLNFDMALQSRNPAWGVRNLEDVIEIANGEGLEFVQSVEMPANNLSVLFQKS